MYSALPRCVTFYWRRSLRVDRRKNIKRERGGVSCVIMHAHVLKGIDKTSFGRLTRFQNFSIVCTRLASYLGATIIINTNVKLIREVFLVLLGHIRMVNFSFIKIVQELSQLPTTFYCDTFLGDKVEQAHSPWKFLTLLEVRRKVGLSFLSW